MPSSSEVALQTPRHQSQNPHNRRTPPRAANKDIMIPENALKSDLQALYVSWKLRVQAYYLCRQALFSNHGVLLGCEVVNNDKPTPTIHTATSLRSAMVRYIFFLPPIDPMYRMLAPRGELDPPDRAKIEGATVAGFKESSTLETKGRKRGERGHQTKDEVRTQGNHDNQIFRVIESYDDFNEGTI
ncbi:hypothetical protein ACEPPN_003659 [Leptodophora sp. 'Broadleaf-Isolate-01']